MNADNGQQMPWHDFEAERERFRTDVLSGLRKSPKELPSKYFYDECGSGLYERICTLDEYYVPRIEVAIMKAHIEEIVTLLGQHVVLIEYGCGNCAKTRILLDHLPDLTAFVPIDISREQLRRVADELTADYPDLEVLPVRADFTTSFQLPTPSRPWDRIVIYFPGSTIGNFDPIPARRFLRHIAGVCGPDGALLIGIDLQKDPAVLNRAYNDPEGITAAFNLNLLERINRELNGDFQLESFRHCAFYNPETGRVEMHLISLRDQAVHLDNVSIPLSKGESIWTENSYKFTLAAFAGMAGEAGFRVARVWTDERQWFSVQYLVSVAGESR